MEACDALLALRESSDLVSYAPLGNDLQEAYAECTDWGCAIRSNDADAWNMLAFELKQAELLCMGNEHVAYEAQEEEELKMWMGGYYNALVDGGCDAIMDKIHM
ncbi:uncharacterized protein ACA1_202500 [Acanthamoeba castellanii str. Neff]|uniref:Uncharacterized protein n=1 Tax=Acanthamoeba castellanii (strain ATCC 30010 / Neff) TaxID=1257118 RepID=L8GTM8_ACACF|nr:uncharacterized protein ACA1_202500 [Acanthamoeba castellanii str. Neff]ELR16277.1 hypothetical protein ACA1_202500 [Acanthamoeba castellanii str. Neff]